MDPTQTWFSLLTALIERDGDAVRVHAEDLEVWLSKGGFVPFVLTHGPLSDLTVPQFIAVLQLLQGKLHP